MAIDLSKYKNEATAGKDINFEIKSFKISKKLSDKKKEVFYRELGMLLKSGVDFKKALEILSHQAKSKLEQSIILAIKEKVVLGKSICEAMIATNQFSPYEYYSIQIGEETRKLEEVLIELQKFFNRNSDQHHYARISQHRNNLSSHLDFSVEEFL